MDECKPTSPRLVTPLAPPAVLLALLLLWTAFLVQTAEAREQVASQAKPTAVGWGFCDVYGIELKVPYEAEEVEIVSMITHNRNGFGSLFEIKDSFSRRALFPPR